MKFFIYIGLLRLLILFPEHSLKASPVDPQYLHQVDFFKDSVRRDLITIHSHTTKLTWNTIKVFGFPFVLKFPFCSRVSLLTYIAPGTDCHI